MSDSARTPAVEVHSVTLDSTRSVVALGCLFRLCHWHSADTRTMSPAEQDAAMRWHLIDEHPEGLATLAQLAGAPAGVCARPHPTVADRFCLEPRGHSSASHGDGHVDRWILR